MEEKNKEMDIKEFVESGYLQEINRRFLHPLGLALAVEFNKETVKFSGSVIDCRDDDEGIKFADVCKKDPTWIKKFQYIESEWIKRSKKRLQSLGYIVQGI